MTTSHVPRRPSVGWAPAGGRERGVRAWLFGLAFLLVLSACTSGNAGAPASLPDVVDDAGGFGGAEVEELLTAPGLGSDDAGDVDGSAGVDGPAARAADRDGPGATPTPEPPRARSVLADQIEFIGSSLEAASGEDGPVPVSLDIPGLGVTGATVTDVGVEADGDMEIPDASEVGWYRFGPRPGDTGSAVLAAHIAYNGVDGVFRNLTEMRSGDRFSVTFSDGSSRSFRVVGLRQWSKVDAPLADLFARDGSPRLVLITCGGTFNRALDSYDDNVVVIAVPVDPVPA